MRLAVKAIKKETIGLISRQSMFSLFTRFTTLHSRESEVRASSKVCTEHFKNRSEKGLRGGMDPAHTVQPIIVYIKRRTIAQSSL